MQWLENFRCNTVDLPHRGVLAGFIDESAESSESESENFEPFAMHLATKIMSHTVRTPRARTHQQQLPGAGMHTVELSDRKLAPENHASRARRARAGLTVYPLWIQIIDVFAASSQSCDRKSKFGLRHGIKLSLLYAMTKSEF